MRMEQTDIIGKERSDNWKREGRQLLTEGKDSEGSGGEACGAVWLKIGVEKGKI